MPSPLPWLLIRKFLVRAAFARIDLGILYRLRDITNLPKPVRHASRHGRGHSQLRMDAHEVVMHHVERDRVGVVRKLLDV